MMMGRQSVVADTDDGGAHAVNDVLHEDPIATFAARVFGGEIVAGREGVSELVGQAREKAVAETMRTLQCSQTNQARDAIDFGSITVCVAR